MTEMSLGSGTLYLTVKSGPAQLRFPKKISPSAKVMRMYGMKISLRLLSMQYLLMFTVVPVCKASVNPCPAGTVKLLRFTVVHWTAVATSTSLIRHIATDVYKEMNIPSTELIVPTHGVVAANADVHLSFKASTVTTLSTRLYIVSNKSFHSNNHYSDNPFNRRLV